MNGKIFQRSRYPFNARIKFIYTSITKERGIKWCIFAVHTKPIRNIAIMVTCWTELNTARDLTAVTQNLFPEDVHLSLTGGHRNVKISGRNMSKPTTHKSHSRQKRWTQTTSPGILCRSRRWQGLYTYFYRPLGTCVDAPEVSRPEQVTILSTSCKTPPPNRFSKEASATHNSRGQKDKINNSFTTSQRQTKNMNMVTDDIYMEIVLHLGQQSIEWAAMTMIGITYKILPHMS